ncbi:putative phosphohistidine phosphatase, SixA [Magnetococcus marinus MC-1]|uniref:Putative phosphohistidine phosphatase, SixA n=1 Tax=Magnetococcus marinus (strain ATCC BAA-1437 / JCM 17883 / MC-1) TaxID=156889 RepID=A0L7W3_MAGMM|nr:histidine phosphatase family protein [Magnetococcus marinus]ABK44056.1 putative phosphohistidine phosphatase, SixA [Magnetococcus marinus MC-1]
MGRELILLRHAKSAWDTDAPTDFERPLAKRGRRDAPRMGRWMAKQGIQPDLVICSPAERTKQTMVFIAKEMGIKKKILLWDDRVYGASLEDLLLVLNGVSKSAMRVMLVGHNPGLELLLSFLVGPDKQGSIYGFGLIKTSTLVQLSMPDQWQDLAVGCAQVQQIMSPKDFKDKKDKK